MVISHLVPNSGPGGGVGMHSHPRFEVIIKISSLTRPDPSMCMHLVLPKKRGKNLNWAPCVCMYSWLLGFRTWQLVSSTWATCWNEKKKNSEKITPCCHQITDLLHVWTLQIFWLSCNYNDPNKKDNPKYHQQISHLLLRNWQRNTPN